MVRPESRAAYPRHHLRPASAGVRRAGSQALLAAPSVRYAVPVYAEVKVARDYHVQLAKALYSIPHHLRGQTISARADGELAKFYHRGQLIKTHPRRPPAPGRPTRLICPQTRPAMPCGICTG